MSEYKVGFIGCGNIASAIIGGCVGSGYIKPELLTVFDTDSGKVEPFSRLGAAVAESASQLTECSDFVFLTVKPQIYDAVLSEIKDASDGVCFVDVAAGITIKHVKDILGFDAPVIRVMPNTPLMYGCGATALVKADPVTDEQYKFIKDMFSCCGVAVDAAECDINTVTAVSGSGPAFVMRFAHDMIDFAVSHGMDRQSAEALVIQTFIGSAEMIRSSELDIGQLIRNVTSPNGTTEAGLRALDELSFDTAVNGCLDSALKRAEELTK